MKLRDILVRVPVTAISGDDGVEITAISDDSRTVVPGALFVAVPGLTVDGATFVDPALSRGAVAVLGEKLPRERAAVMVETPDSKRALALAAAAFHGEPASKLSLIGITGTSGKTTTAKMVESIIDATGEPAGLIGTIEYRAGAEREIADRTTPDAIALQRWFRRMVDGGVRLAVMEVSSHALVLERVYGVPFRAAVFTNISRDHFDFHRDFEDYYAAKRRLFDMIDRSGRNAVVNIDDSWGERLAGELGATAVTFGSGPRAEIRPAGGFEMSVDGLHGDLETPWGGVRIDSKLIGAPNLSNWMAAVGAALVAGVDRNAIEQGVAALTAVRGRFERVGGAGDPTVLVDYAHKPDALDKLLRAARELDPARRLVVVFGCGGDRDRGKRPVMGEIAGRLADYTIVTSDNPRSEDPRAIIGEIEDGIRGASKEYEIVVDRREAIERALSLADESTTVIVAGKGHENYQVVGDRIVHFDDREEVEAAFRKTHENVS
jgi:UDP-N-acetylmuramoyl-L-alanyl-D-glutamate--2,6-diaminopimelate ligase